MALKEGFASPPIDDLWSHTAAIWDVFFNATTPTAVAHRARARLTHLVDFARRRSPFYARHLRNVARADAFALADLPAVSKCELMAHFDDWATDHAVTRAAVDAFIDRAENIGDSFLGRYVVWTSSGSTGTPGIFVQDERSLALYNALELVRFRGLGPMQWLPHMLSTDERYALVAATGGPFAGCATAARLVRTQPWLANALRVISILQPLDELVAALNEFQPTCLASYPSVANVLAEEQRAGRLRLRLAELWCGGEQLSAAVRRQAEQSFACRLREAYGASEFMSIAWSCADGALHVNSDWVLLEPVDADLQPTAPGQISHTTLLTNLANLTQPLIRYDIGDRMQCLAAPCACGSEFPAIRVEGRTDDTLEFDGTAGHVVKLLPLALATVLEEGAEVHGFQLVRRDSATIELRLPSCEQRENTAQRCRQQLRRFLRRQHLENVQVLWRGDAPAPDPVSGKLRCVIASPSALDVAPAAAADMAGMAGPQFGVH